MNSSVLRVQLALALGLPACGSSSSSAPGPVPPPATAATAASTASASSMASGPAVATHCQNDQIYETVCGLVSTDTEKAGGLAPAPFAHCTLNGRGVWSVDVDTMRDGWRLRNDRDILATFSFDPGATQTYKSESPYEPDEPRCCYERCNPLDAVKKPRAALPQGAHEYELCVPRPESTAFPAATAPQCPVAIRTRHFYPYGAEDPLDDAPFARVDDDECCYSVATLHRCPPNTLETKDGSCQTPTPGGRPLREDGHAITARTTARADWQTATRANAARWSEATRAHAAAAWAREAAFEHASVAAFARLAIDLMVHGAPADLVDAAHVAARDEIRHAQQCYGLAAAFGSAAVGPSGLALATSTTAKTLDDLAVECFRDGCVNETVAALQVAEGARRASDPALAATLAAIAEDESRHATLSYRIVQWALRARGDALRTRLAAELAALRAELAQPAIAADAHPAHDETTGLLTPATALAVRRHTLADVILPSTEALLAVTGREE